MFTRNSKSNQLKGQLTFKNWLIDRWTYTIKMRSSEMQ